MPLPTSRERKATVLELAPEDDFASLRYRLRALEPGRVALDLPWDAGFLSRQVDFDLLWREAEACGLEVAIVSADPERRGVARAAGFPTFANVSAALGARKWRAHRPASTPPPPRHWWQAPIDLRPRPARPRPRWLTWLMVALRVFVFLASVAVLGGAGYLIVPSASVTLAPAGRRFTTIVLVSVDPDVTEVNPSSGVIPARRVGLEVEGFLEVPTTGVVDVAAGRAVGEVLFTNLLTQDYVVPAGTIVRTSSTSYPVRFRTTADVVVPASGQAAVRIEALDEGIGNVGAFQINQVEGSAAVAVRVINPQSTTGAEPQEKRAVVQADYDRARAQLTRQLLDQAQAELERLDILVPTEFVPRESLRIEAVPKEAYTHFIGEQADTVGLNLRLLVSGLAVDSDNAEAVAYAELLRRLPAGYTLIDARFELGEVAEEDIGPGQLALFVTAHAYAAATLDSRQAAMLIRGQPVDAARQRLMAELPLAEPPVIRLWPEQMRRVPWLPLRIHVDVLVPTST
jgi:hypothetical protein